MGGVESLCGAEGRRTGVRGEEADNPEENDSPVVPGGLRFTLPVKVGSRGTWGKDGN